MMMMMIIIIIIVIVCGLSHEKKWAASNLTNDIKIDDHPCLF
jgi:hypothetical protein